LQPVLAATGLHTPADSISNEELVQSFNAWVARHNADHAEAIAAGAVAALEPSSVEFIEKASGIRSRFVLSKAPILDPEVMAPRIPERPNEALSVLAEMAVAAAGDALSRAGREGGEIDAVICACSNLQRAYPAIAIEVQEALGADGFAFDMNVACSSATFGLQVAADMVRNGSAARVLVVNPEVCSGHLNWRDRDSHFIFGDVATAMIVEADGRGTGWEILGTKLLTRFSNHIRNNFGFLNRAAPEGVGSPDKLFVQEGRKVFKDVVPMVSDLILGHLAELGVAPAQLRRLWLHQANANMNRLIAARVLGHEASEDKSPTVLDRYANTSSAGSVIAFHLHSADLAVGDLGLLCSFGAGYSAGSVVLRKGG
jgi:beta-ketodecanoyl-[acyl-carrier-protein] synthase